MTELARIPINTAALAAVCDDITSMDVDVVVNAANEQLAHGGGVAAAISDAAGPALQEESYRWVADHGLVTNGTAATTSGGDLPARWVVHTVGPRYREGQDNPKMLADAVEAALDAADRVDAATVAMPAISAGVFGYPPDEATQVIARAAAEYLRSHPGNLTEVFLVGYDQAMASRFSNALESLD
jgi:putative ATPase